MSKEEKLIKLKSKLESSFKTQSDSTKKIERELLDSQTSLILHKNALINLMKENVNEELIENQANPNIETTDILASLLISSKENDKLCERLQGYFNEKEDLNKFYYNILYTIETKKTKNEYLTVTYTETNKILENTVTNKKADVENKVRDHDKYITSDSVNIRKENYVYYPTKQNLELYLEKVQGLEIMNKLTTIMDEEKSKYTKGQQQIKSLINRISTNKKVIKDNYNTIIEESNLSNIINTNNSNKKEKNDTISDNQNQLHSYASVRDSAKFSQTFLEDNIDETLSYKVNINHLGETMDSNLFQFPNKIKFNTNYNTETVCKEKDIPKLNFGNIMSKYKNDKNVIIKVEKVDKPDKYNEILLDLIGKDKTSNKKNDVKKLKEEANELENLLEEKRDDLFKQKRILKENKSKNNKLAENITDADERIQNLLFEINKIKNKQGKDDDNDIDLPVNDSILKENDYKSDEENDLYVDIFNFEENKNNPKPFNQAIFKNIQLNKLKN